ncbi:hypothetical protein MOO46_05935 [Apilactobacillus apisilvae]|uniref:Uncharacterized protein n=1 Tax=Apilactobacillus apisilvae TaxID=2923364 RepID=A0ABY4PG46_9LACO|nr:hypothetical protein [Apilactobacillus apisilvae]UQS84783.1 hypothetical protein MOO46_05935 [Apilactobacillus apisilvae]
MHQYENKVKKEVKTEDNYKKEIFINNIIRCDYWITDEKIQHKIFKYIEEEENSIALDKILNKDELNQLTQNLSEIIKKSGHENKNYLNDRKDNIGKYVDVFRKGEEALLSI